MAEITYFKTMTSNSLCVINWLSIAGLWSHKPAYLEFCQPKRKASDEIEVKQLSKVLVRSLLRGKLVNWIYSIDSVVLNFPLHSLYPQLTPEFQCKLLDHAQIFSSQYLQHSWDKKRISNGLASVSLFSEVVRGILKWKTAQTISDLWNQSDANAIVCSESLVSFRIFSVSTWTILNKLLLNLY